MRPASCQGLELKISSTTTPPPQRPSCSTADITMSNTACVLSSNLINSSSFDSGSGARPLLKSRFAISSSIRLLDNLMLPGLLLVEGFRKAIAVNGHFVREGTACGAEKHHQSRRGCCNSTSGATTAMTNRGSVAARRCLRTMARATTRILPKA